MRTFLSVRAVLLAFLFATALGLSAVSARAAGPTPQQIQAMITTGHPDKALAELRGALRDHPHSGVAWFLKAEAEDATGHAAAAREALSRAESYAPGLPFANAARVEALKAHLAAAPRSGIRGILTHPATLIIGGLVILFLLMRWFSHNRRMNMQPPYPNGYGYGPNGVPPGAPPPGYGPGYGPGGGFMGGGLGSSILTGLAAGAGFAAGERIIDGIAGERGGPAIDPTGGDPGLPPDRDDGLMGNPGWDDGTGFGDGGGDFDPDNNW